MQPVDNRSTMHDQFLRKAALARGRSMQYKNPDILHEFYGA